MKPILKAFLFAIPFLLTLKLCSVIPFNTPTSKEPALSLPTFSTPEFLENSSDRIGHYENHLFRGLTESDRIRKLEKLVSAFGLLRATAPQFYVDFFSHPKMSDLAKRLSHFSNNQLFEAIVSADNHLENFSWDPVTSAKTGKVQQIIEFELAQNDFDEAVVGPWILDIVRLMSSIAVKATESGFSTTQIDRALQLSAESFTLTLNELSRKDRHQQDAAEKKLSEKMTQSIQVLTDHLDKIRKYDGDLAIKKWTQQTKGHLRFRDDSTLPIVKQKILPLNDSTELARHLKEAFEEYVKRQKNSSSFSESYFQIIDMAYRVNAGTGSLGTPRFFILLRGDKGRPIILDIKGVPKPNFYPYLSSRERDIYDEIYGENHALRAIEGHRAMTRDDRALAGWLHLYTARDQPTYYSVNRVSPGKYEFPTNQMIPNRFKKNRQGSNSDKSDKIEKRLNEVSTALATVTALNQNRAYRRAILARPGMGSEPSFAKKAWTLIASYGEDPKLAHKNFQADLVRLSSIYAMILLGDYKVLTNAGVLKPNPVGNGSRK